MWEQWSSLARHEVIVHSALQEGYVCNSYTGMSSRHVIFCTCEVVFYDLILLIAASQDDHLSITMARTVANENSLGLVCMPAAEVMAIIRWFTPSPTSSACAEECHVRSSGTVCQVGRGCVPCIVSAVMGCSRGD